MSVQEHISSAKNQISQIFSNLETQISKEMEAATPQAGGEGATTEIVGKLRNFCYDMNEATTQGEIASILLKASDDVFERTVLFIVKGSKIVSWQGVGLKGQGSPKEKVSVSIPSNMPSILQSVVNEKVGKLESFKPSPGNNKIIQALGNAKPTMISAIPMVANNKVRLILYGDNAHSQQELPDVSSLEILMINAELAMENVSLKKSAGKKVGKKGTRKRRPVKKSAPPPAAPSGAPSMAQPKEQQAPQPQPQPKPEPKKPEPEPQPQPQHQPQQQAQPFQQQTQAAPTPQQQPSVEEQKPTGAGIQPPKTQVAEKEGMDESERKQHEEAKAFASVIVSDIALYNQQKIEEGLKNDNLKQLLGSEFERGRRLYQQRVSPAVAKSTNYYDQAIQEMIQKKKKALNL